MKAKHREYIGDTLTVTKSPNKELIGRTGRVTDETQHTFTVQTSSGAITILKKHQEFQIGADHVSGAVINKKPHSRLNIKSQ